MNTVDSLVHFEKVNITERYHVTVTSNNNHIIIVG